MDHNGIYIIKTFSVPDDNFRASQGLFFFGKSHCYRLILRRIHNVALTKSILSILPSVFFFSTLCCGMSVNVPLMSYFYVMKCWYLCFSCHFCPSHVIISKSNFIIRLGLIRMIGIILSIYFIHIWKKNNGIIKAWYVVCIRKSWNWATLAMGDNLIYI